MVLRAALLGMTALSALAACTSGQTASIPAVATPNVAKGSTLQFAVGTATIGLANNVSSVGLNVVATFRQPNGNNAVGADTPTITGPAGLNFGPLLGNSNTITGVTPAQLATFAGEVRAAPTPGATPYPLASAAAAGFGPYVGVFGYGLAGDNLISSSDVAALNPLIGSNPVCLGIATNYLSSYYGNPPNLGGGQTATGVSAPNLPTNLVRSSEPALPVPSGPHGTQTCSCPSTCAPAFSTFDDSSFPVQYFGGPPAWPSPQGYGSFSYFAGFPLGFTDFTATPVAGVYSLSVAFATSADYHTFGSISATARLPAASVAAPLSTFPQPALAVNADGSGTITVNVPAGVREAVVTVTSDDCDLTGTGRGTDHYALVTHQTGRQTLFLSSSLGPPDSVTGIPSHTFCTVADIQAFNAVATANQTPLVHTLPVHTLINAVGFDYPAYEASYPQNLSAAPAITNGDGHSGQADVTTSYPEAILTNVSLPTGS